jgi:L-malate glycosyltransferase
LKVLILANPDSIHTRRWVISLCEEGIEVVLFSLHNFEKSHYSSLPNFISYSLHHSGTLNSIDSKLKKIAYLTAVSKIKKVIIKERPDILHAHYSSSYGLLGALSKFHPFIISVWGSDIYDFPHSSRLAKRIIRYNLSRADRVLSTSKAMAVETCKYYSGEVVVTPFGVDLIRFIKNRNRKFFSKADIVIGTIKTLEKIYGIEFLIRAFAKVVAGNSSLSLKLLIIGRGSCEIEYKKLVVELNMEDKVIFTGFIDHSEINVYYNNIDIFVVPSLRESFGVSVLEASACEIPVIVTNTGGLPEVIEQNSTGYIVPCQDESAIAEAIQKYLNDPQSMIAMGENGRKMVENRYDWLLCVDRMVEVYQSLL